MSDRLLSQRASSVLARGAAEGTYAGAVGGAGRLPERTRQIGTVQWVEPISSPFGATRARGCTPAAEAGLAYERRVVRELERRGLAVEHGQWWAFEDENGEGVCSPDIYLPALHRVIEVKLSLTWKAFVQLENYRKVLACNAGGRSPAATVVCKNWREVGGANATAPPYSSFEEMLEAASGVLLWG